MASDIIETLHLVNYRGFEDFTFGDLSRVNLLVGDNNCGKTCVLEAAEFLASRGDPGAFMRAALRRGEVLARASARYGARFAPVLSHLFYGHELSIGAQFYIDGGTMPGRVEAEVAPLDESEPTPTLFGDEPYTGQRTLFEEGLDSPRSVCAIEFRSTNGSTAIRTASLHVGKQGVVSLDALGQSRVRHLADTENEASVQLIAPDSLSTRAMAKKWDNVMMDGREREVVQAMRILEPRLESIAFLSEGSHYDHASSMGIVVGLEGSRRRHPLGSYGDGMRRLLSLSVSLVQAHVGLLLVDEIDTGLHYSVMSDMWRLVVNAARRYDIQVFATTHSLDCIKGLAEFCQTEPALAAEVSLHKITPGLRQSASLDGEHIPVAVRGGLEVR